MCFSATASYSAAAVLLPTGLGTIRRVYRQPGSKYVALAFLPLFFGLQQLFEGLIWTSSSLGHFGWVETFSLAYMFFAWLVWPVWIPYSAFFLEPCRRRRLYLVFAILGGMLGALQYFPYFAHDNWLVVRLMENAVSYEGKILFDLMMRREITNTIYMAIILAPLLTSSSKHLRIFGCLVALVTLVVFVFFREAYISVFCFGAALMSLHLVYVIFHETGPEARPASDLRAGF